MAGQRIFEGWPLRYALISSHVISQKRAFEIGLAFCYGDMTKDSTLINTERRTMVKCPSCHRAVNKSVLDAAERIDSEVKRIMCPHCSREFYTYSMHHVVLALPSRRLVRSRTFYCPKCKVRTAGIPWEVLSDDRYCPICRRLLC